MDYYIHIARRACVCIIDFSVSCFDLIKYRSDVCYVYSVRLDISVVFLARVS